MRKTSISALVLVAIFLVGTIYGVAINRYDLFPYPQIKKAYQSITHKVSHNPNVTQKEKKTAHNGVYDTWSIGVYEGSTPFNLAPPIDIKNPVLTAENVINLRARFVADPFMVINKGKYYLFFEVLNRATHQGDIGYAESVDGKKWEYKQIVVDEPFHLSYPYVFEWNKDYYMIPESGRDFSVRLYKATSFPDKWVFVGNLLSGYRYVDNSIVRYNDKWWLFVCTGQSNVLNLYYSDNLMGKWKPHPMNPIVKLNKHLARPGGRIILYNDKLYRFAQDCDPEYGMQVFAIEITKISEEFYEEKLASETPVVTMTGSGWNAAGMHQVDVQKVGDKWIAVVDGRSE